MKSKHFLFVFLLQVAAFSVQAARVDTVFVKSPSMNKDVKVVYILPDKAVAKNPQACPAVYLLHGYGGNARTWIGIRPELPQIADEKGIIFVCPDGKNSWYWDSPKDPSYRYETFISSELVNYTDTHYAAIPEKRGRAITGLSMGGHGALWNAIRHKDVKHKRRSRYSPVSQQLGDEETIGRAHCQRGDMEQSYSNQSG